MYHVTAERSNVTQEAKYEFLAAVKFGDDTMGYVHSAQASPHRPVGYSPMRLGSEAKETPARQLPGQNPGSCCKVVETPAKVLPVHSGRLLFSGPSPLSYLSGGDGVRLKGCDWRVKIPGSG